MTRFRMPLLFPWLFALLVAAPAVAESLADTPFRTFQIRATSQRLRAALDEGMRESPTFRALVNHINASDVIVYLEHDRGTLPRGVDGRLTFLSASGGFRYVVIKVGWQLGYQQQLAIIGHELQHAVEVADDIHVVDAGSLARAYHRIGYRSAVHENGVSSFDSLAAVRAGEQVLREVMR